MTKEQWRNPEFRRRYYRERKKKQTLPPKPRLGVFAEAFTTYRSIRPRGYCNFDMLHSVGEYA